MSHDDFSRSAKEKLQSSRQRVRQLGVGSQGGAEALAIFQQIPYDEWAASSLNEPLARIKVDEKK